MSGGGSTGGPRVVMVRHDGTEASERDAHNFHFPAFVRTIGPGTADVARFAVTIPKELAGKRVRIEARLQWRKFNRKCGSSALKILGSRQRCPSLRNHAAFRALPVGAFLFG